MNSARHSSRQRRRLQERPRAVRLRRRSAHGPAPAGTPAPRAPSSVAASFASRAARAGGGGRHLGGVEQRQRLRRGGAPLAASGSSGCCRAGRTLPGTGTAGCGGRRGRRCGGRGRAGRGSPSTACDPCGASAAPAARRPGRPPSGSSRPLDRQQRVADRLALQPQAVHRARTGGCPGRAALRGVTVDCRYVCGREHQPVQRASDASRRRRTRRPASRAVRGASAARRGRRSRSASARGPGRSGAATARLTITRAVSGLSGTRPSSPAPAAGRCRRPWPPRRRPALPPGAGPRGSRAAPRLALLAQVRRAPARYVFGGAPALSARPIATGQRRPASGRRTPSACRCNSSSLAPVGSRDGAVESSASTTTHLRWPSPPPAPVARRCARSGGRPVRGPRLGRELGQLRLVQPAAVRPLQRLDAVAQRPASGPGTRPGATRRRPAPPPWRPGGRGGTRPARRTPAAGSSPPAEIGSNLWSWQRAQVSVSPRNASAGRVGHVVERVRAAAGPGRAASVMSGPSRLNPVATQRVGVAGDQLVAGELLHDEAVVGLVRVEAADDVVAVPPGVGPGLVELVAVGVGVAGQVEPVPAPALAVTRDGEQPVDDLLPRLRGRRRGRRRRSPPGSGGRPVRSNVARRMSGSRVAGAAGATFSAASRLRMKASTGWAATAGTGAAPAASTPSGRPATGPGPAWKKQRRPLRPAKRGVKLAWLQEKGRGGSKG